MPRITDEALDKLFRGAAENVNTDFDPGDWDDMSRKLEREEKLAKARNISLYSLVVLLMLYSLWSPIIDKPGMETATLNPIRSSIPATGGDDQQASQSTSSERDNNATGGLSSTEEVKTDLRDRRSPVVPDVDKTDELQSETNGGSSSVDSDDASVNLSAANPLIIDEANSSVTKRSGTSDVDHSVTVGEDAVQNGKVSSTRADGTQSQNHTRLEQGKASSISHSDDRRDTGNEVPRLQQGSGRGVYTGEPSSADVAIVGDGVKALQSLDLFNRRLPLMPDSVHRLEITHISLNKPNATAGETVIRQDAGQGRHPVFIRLSVAPDLSSIDYGSTGKTGVNIGLLGEYHLSPRFSVTTGAIWSKKLYDQKNPEGTYSSGGWSAKIWKLDGDCRVIDIPVNVTYYMFPEKRTNIFVTVGASSYIMLREDYDYTVWKNQQYVTYSQSVENKNKEWFSMLNVSIGVQQRIGSRAMLQVEPFLKAPMSGVGEGKVNLVSTGAFVSFKYRVTR